MVLANKLYGIKDSANMQLISLKTGRVVLEIEQPNSVEQSWSNTGVTEARNHGSRAIVWDGKKEGTITANVEVINSELLAIMSKAELKKEAIDVRVSKEFKVTEDAQVLDISGLGNVTKVTDVFVLNKDKTKKKDVTDDSVVDLSGKTVTLSGVAIGETVKVYGVASEIKTHFTIKDKDEVTEDYMLVFDTLGKTQESGEEDYFQYQFFKVHVNFEYTVAHDTENPASIDIKFEVMKDDEGRLCTYVSAFDDDEDSPVVEPARVFVGGILDTDKAGLTVTTTLLDSLEKVESVAKSIPITVPGTAINGKSILIISTAKITQLLDGTGLDSISIMTEVEKDGDDGEHYFCYYETDSTPNGNSDTNFTVKL